MRTPHRATPRSLTPHDPIVARSRARQRAANAALTLSLLSAAALPMVGPLGCAGANGRARAVGPREDIPRDAAQAQRLVERAALDAEFDPDHAATMLKQAVLLDPLHAQAHNNLGAILLQQRDLFGAATAFECARTLLPQSAAPRLNLGLTLERAGRTDDAIDAYTSALEVDPGRIEAVQALARLQLRAGRRSTQTTEMLRIIALRGTTQGWRDWARLEAAKRRRPE